MGGWAGDIICRSLPKGFAAMTIPLVLDRCFAIQVKLSALRAYAIQAGYDDLADAMDHAHDIVSDAATDWAKEHADLGDERDDDEQQPLPF